MAGHFAGVVGCDFCTGRTGSGAMFTCRGAGGVVGAGVAEVTGAAGWAAWQPQVTAPSRITPVSRAVIALIVATAFLSLPDQAT
jgi:hypothetical protein